MKTIKGPAIFLAQFLDDKAPFNNLDNICQWAASLGFKGIQIPTWDKRVFDLEQAAISTMYCNDVQAIAHKHGIVIAELSTHLQGQLVAVHPAYHHLFSSFAPENLRSDLKAMQQWGALQVTKAAQAAKNLGINAVATFSGALMWHLVFPWPQRPKNIIEDGFDELAKRWTPILNTYLEAGVDLCYEIHPGEDLHDGLTFELFLDKVKHHKAANILYDPSHLILQSIDYVGFIDCYHERIKMFHVKDAEFNPTAKSGAFGGYQNWLTRAGRFRSLGDGQVDFKRIFSKLTQYDFSGWAVLEWECCLKNQEVGAAEGAHFIKNHIIPVTEKNFDDFAGTKPDKTFNQKILGINEL
ncbi:MAG: sugar phosphate isomerase/epimerase [Sediminibacterium sp.]|nr:sugar phosphate isomerase/epimerase [Sediminibacterium sp.]